MSEVIKKFEINGKEYTLELSCPLGAGTPYNQGIEPSYHVCIDRFYLGRIRRQNGFWYPVDSFGHRPKNPDGLERVLLIFEAADFQAMGELIENSIKN